MNSVERGSSVALVPVFATGEVRFDCVELVTLLPLEGENSGVLGLSLEAALVGGEGEMGACIDFVGLNTGAEGLSLVLGGENSGVVGLMDELLLSLSLGVVGCSCAGSCSILLWFPSIREGAVGVDLVTSVVGSSGLSN